MLVRVVVTDEQGRSVGSLSRDDFRLFDKGKPQVISKFAVEKGGGKSAFANEEAPPVADEERLEPPTTALTLPGNFVVYLFDDVHLPFGDLARARMAAERHLAESLPATTRAAIYTTSGQTMQEFTDDRDKLRETLRLIRPRALTGPKSFECPDISYYMADLIENKNDGTALGLALQEAIACGAVPQDGGRTAEAVVRMQTRRVLLDAGMENRIAFDVLKKTVARLSAMPGQRSIVFVSPGFLVLWDQRAEQMEVVERAIRSNVAISAIDARGLYVVIPGGDASQPAPPDMRTLLIKTQYQQASASAEGDVLAEMADGTGGRFFHNSNDLEAGFKRVAAPPEYHFVLAFAPQNLKLDGSYHPLKVTLRDGKGLTVQARRGYYAPKHEADPGLEARREIEEALFSRDEMDDIPVQMQTQFFKASDVNARLAVIARVDISAMHFQKVDERNRNTLTIVAGLFDRHGNYISGIQKTISMRLRDSTLERLAASGITAKTSFDVAPGGYMVRVVVRDTEGRAMAARNGVVEIP